MTPAEPRAHDSNPVRVAILLPTLNEEEGLAKTIPDLPLDHLRDSGFLPQIVVIDGRSTDRSVEVARGLGAQVLVQTGNGKGQATREGIAWAAEHGFAYAVVMDADYTYPGTGLASMVSLLDSGSDLAIGVRRPEFDPLGVARTALHRFGDGVLNYFAAQLSHSPILDVCSGLWGIRTSVVPELALESTGFEIEAEVFLKAFRHGLSVTQVPVNYRARVGVAKLHALRDGVRIFLAIVRHSGVAMLRPDRLRPAEEDPEVVWGRRLREVHAICLSSAAERLVVFAPANRQAEAEELARRLRAGKVGATVEVQPYDPVKQTVLGVPSPLPIAEAPRSGDKVPIVVSLPPLSDDGSPMSIAAVGLPGTGHLVYLPMGAACSIDDDEMAESGAYRIRFGLDRSRTRSLAILSQAFGPSQRRKELALLSANASAGDVRIYRQEPNGRSHGLDPEPAVPS